MSADSDSDRPKVEPFFQRERGIRSAKRLVGSNSVDLLHRGVYTVGRSRGTDDDDDDGKSFENQVKVYVALVVVVVPAESSLAYVTNSRRKPFNFSDS